MKRALPQYTAPAEFLAEAAAVSARHAAERGDSGLPAAHRPRCVAAREDDYRRQWRQRACLSPPQADPYARLAARGRAPPPQAPHERPRTYRDVMAEHGLDVEQAEVERALARKRREEEEATATATTENKDGRDSKGEGEDDAGPRWLLAVVKGGATLAQVDLGAVARASRDGTVKFGAAGAGCDVVLSHASCSAHHAKLRMPPPAEAGDGAEGGEEEAACPRIVDLGSAHGTFVDGERLAPGVYRALHDGAVVTFAQSTREYLVMRR